MSSPLNVDPDQVNSTGAHWYVLIPQLGDAPPSSTGQGWPSGAGAMAVTGAGGASTLALQQGLTETAGNMQGAGAAYQHQEGSSAGGMKPGDFTGMMNDLIGAGTTLIQVAPQLLQSVTSALSSAISGGASAISSTVSAVSHGGGTGSGANGNAPQVALPAIEGQNQPQEEHHDEASETSVTQHQGR